MLKIPSAFFITSNLYLLLCHTSFCSQLWLFMLGRTDVCLSIAVQEGNHDRSFHQGPTYYSQGVRAFSDFMISTSSVVLGSIIQWQLRGLKKELEQYHPWGPLKEGLQFRCYPCMGMAAWVALLFLKRNFLKNFSSGWPAGVHSSFGALFHLINSLSH